MQRRQIFVHVGIPKTGSSALQQFFSKNVTALARLGIAYPMPEGASVIDSGYCTGNLVHVAQEMAAKDGFRRSRFALLARYLRPVVQKGLSDTSLDKIVFSSEMIPAVATDTLFDFFDGLREEYDITFVAFCRDAYDHTLSVWKQRTKSGRNQLSLDDFVAGQIEKDGFSLPRLCALMDAGFKVRLINYDVHKRAIVPAFLNVLGVEYDPNLFEKSRKAVSNPSLAYWQAELVVETYQHVGSDRLTAALIARLREYGGTGADPYFPAQDSQILEHLRPTTERLNQLLPQDGLLREQPRSTEAIVYDVPSQKKMRPLLEAMRDVLDAPDIMPSRMHVKRLPPGFDPVVYLLLNPDLVAAGVEPVSHYLNHGAFEGRVYCLGLG